MNNIELIVSSSVIEDKKLQNEYVSRIQQLLAELTLLNEQNVHGKVVLKGGSEEDALYTEIEIIADDRNSFDKISAVTAKYNTKCTLTVTAET